jgi:hypothetical protein
MQKRSRRDRKRYQARARRLIKDKTLLALPVLPRDRDGAAASDRITSTYVVERTAIKTSGDLTAFLERWRTVWLLSRGPSEESALLTDAELNLLDGNYDPVRVLHFLNENDFDPSQCMAAQQAAHIMLPRTLLRAFLLSNKYGVGPDLGMVRLYLDPYPELINELR